METGEKREFPWTVYMLSPCGRYAVSPDLRRIGLTQAGYGVIVRDPASFQNDGCPEVDGVFITDLEQGTCQLAVSIAQLVGAAGIIHHPGDAFYVFHVKWSPQDGRIMVVLRCIPANGRQQRRWVLTCNRDGSNIHCLVPDTLWAQGGHHPNWYPDGKRVIMNLRHDPEGPLRFCEIIDDPEPRVESLTGLTGSGHPTIHQGGKWLLSDAYLREHLAPEGCSPLRLVNLETGEEQTLAVVPAKPNYPGPKQEWRVDLHPSWCHDWRHITFNGWHEGRRAVFMADLSSVFS